MKKPNNRLKLMLVSLFFCLSFISNAAEENPDPFDGAPPDYVPPAPIDSHLLYLAVLGLLVAFYFLILKKKKLYS
jgi:hypothetical protein